MIKKIFDDPSGGIINQRYFFKLISTFSQLDIDDKEKEELYSLLLLISIKLASIWKHKNNYNKLEEELILRAKEKPIISGKIDNQIQYSQDMFNEFDEFLVQIKSCLDHLAKVPAIIYGKKCWHLRTFSEEGEDVIKSFENNTPAQYKKFVPCVVNIIRNHQEKWFKDIISARNRINHFIEGGINFQNFVVAIQKTDTAEELVVPRWSNEQTIREMLEVTWMNIFIFAEDFSMCLLSMRLKIEYGLYKIPLPKGSNPIESPWKLDLNFNIAKILKDYKLEF